MFGQKLKERLRQAFRLSRVVPHWRSSKSTQLGALPSGMAPAAVAAAVTTDSLARQLARADCDASRGASKPPWC